MVRLFVPEGEGEHLVLQPVRGSIAAAQPTLITAPLQYSSLGLLTTGALALVGRAHPGIFLRSVAFFGAIGFTSQACSIYGKHELNKAVFKLDGIRPTPGKLWERTKHWTPEDTALSGGLAGIFLALHPRGLPGVYGWRRFFGAAIVGSAVSQQFVLTAIGVPTTVVFTAKRAEAALQRREYQKLSRDESAKKSLSRVGKAALWWYTNPYIQVLRSPMDLPIREREEASNVAGASSARVQHPQSHIDKSKSATYSLEFKKDEINGPDMEVGSRMFNVDWKDTNLQEVREWQHKVDTLKESLVNEYIWLLLQTDIKEEELNNMAKDDPNRDSLRRELRILDKVKLDMWMKSAFWTVHCRDARARLHHMEGSKRIDSVVEQTVDTVPVLGSDVGKTGLAELKEEGELALNMGEVTAQAVPDHSTRGISGQAHPVVPLELADVQKNREEFLKYHKPELVVDFIRAKWAQQKQLLGQIEHGLQQYQLFAPEEGTPLAENQKELEKYAENFKKHIQATERLLRWTEKAVEDAEEQIRREQAAGSTNKRLG